MMDHIVLFQDHSVYSATARYASFAAARRDVCATLAEGHWLRAWVYPDNGDDAAKHVASARLLRNGTVSFRVTKAAKGGES